MAGDGGSKKNRNEEFRASRGRTVLNRVVRIDCDFFYINFIYLFIFLAALGLRCCTRAFSSCYNQGLLFIAVHGLLTGVASLDAEHGL